MIELSVVLPADGEGPQLARALTRLEAALAPLDCTREILVALSTPDAAADAAAAGRARVVTAAVPGYGAALAAGFAAAAGTWVLTLDADVVAPGPIVRDLWQRRREADVLIGSRYVPGGAARMPARRAWLSRALNAVFGRGLPATREGLALSADRAAVRTGLAPRGCRLPAGFCDTISVKLVQFD